MNWRTFCVVSGVLIIAGCSSMPRAFVTTRVGDAGEWKVVEVREGLSNDQAWAICVDTLSQKYDLEVIQKDGGYIRTAWKYTSLDGAKISGNYRTCFVIKLSGAPNWDKAQLKCESNWREDEDEEWIAGYDSQLLGEMYGDIQGKIGRVRR
jgi:hypothetical protein